MKILLVLTSHDELGNIGRKTGFSREEPAATARCGISPRTELDQVRHS